MANKHRKGMRAVKSVPHSKRVGIHSVRVSEDRTQKIKKVEKTERMRLYGIAAINRNNSLEDFIRLLDQLGVDTFHEIWYHYRMWENRRADRIRNG